MLCALIMAGGKGTRFWPLSTEEKPKQFLKLIGKDTMIQMTVNRIKDIIPIERIFVCTGRDYCELVKKQLPELPERNLIIEPEGRNTAPCVALSSMVINRYYKDATMLVLPADHLINKEEEFRSIITEANDFLRLNQEAIVTLGMKPNRPETGYGYIKEGQAIRTNGKHEIRKVNAFVEKPNAILAEKYLLEGSYLWNGGIFMWTVNGILDKFKRFQTSTYKALQGVLTVKEEMLQKEIDTKYMYTEATSVDYGILEKSKDIYVYPSNIGWDDIGSWEAIERYKEKDEQGNIQMGDVQCINSNNNLIISTTRQVVIDELDDIYLIENDGKIIVGRKSKVKNVKEFKEIV